MSDQDAPRSSSVDAGTEKSAAAKPASDKTPAEKRNPNKGTQDGPAPETNGPERSWKTFFVQEWSLLLLAAAMTLTSWLIVREQIVKEHVIQDVWVELAVDRDQRDRIGAVLLDKDNKIDVKLRCSEREKNEAFQALIRNGRPTVTLRIRQEPAAEHRPFIRGEDTYDWPFDAQRILEEDELPAGRVFRLSHLTARVEAPATVRSAEALEKDEGLKVTIVPDQPSVDLDVPENVFDVPLTPDKVRIDPGEFALKEDGTHEGKITLTFAEWRERDDGEAWRRAYRAQLKLPTIQATVTLTQVGEARISNRLLVLLPGDAYQVDTERLAEDNDSVPSHLPLMFTGALRGPKRVLDELKPGPDDAGAGNLDRWSWGIRLKQDPRKAFAGADVVPDKNGYIALTAEIVWLPYAGFQNRGVRFAPAAGETDFTIYVRKREP